MGNRIFVFHGVDYTKETQPWKNFSTFQEDKEPLFDVCDTLRGLLQVATGTLITLQVRDICCDAWSRYILVVICDSVTLSHYFWRFCHTLSR